MKAHKEIRVINDKHTLRRNLSIMMRMLGVKRVIHASRFQSIMGWSDRESRAIAAFSDGKVISTNAGYILNCRATDSEFSEANGRIQKQAEKMLKRAKNERIVRGWVG